MTKLPKYYFKGDHNRRLFLEKLGSQLRINKASDWGKVTFQQILDNGGSKLLRIYGNSLFNTLVSTFTGTFTLKHNSVRYKLET